MGTWIQYGFEPERGQSEERAKNINNSLLSDLWDGAGRKEKFKKKTIQERRADDYLIHRQKFIE